MRNRDLNDCVATDHTLDPTAVSKLSVYQLKSGGFLAL